MADTLFHIDGNQLIANRSLDFSKVISQQKSILKQIDTLLNAPFETIVIDLSPVESIPSTAMGICMAAARKAKELNKQLTIRIKKKHSGAVALTGLHELVSLEIV